VGHVTIGDRANVAAQSGVAHDVGPGERVAGTPAKSDVAWARNSAVFDRLTDMRRELRTLQKQVALLQQEKSP
jgi:UDP-3-O-[3-hydroxymyristoyl] glucosamine N-acyltransferase